MSSSFVWEDANFWEDLFYGEFYEKKSSFEFS
jgi:hypothetical protein